jgi:hypothetical protein
MGHTSNAGTLVQLDRSNYARRGYLLGYLVNGTFSAAFVFWLVCFAVEWLTALLIQFFLAVSEQTNKLLAWEAMDLLAVVQMLWEAFRAEEDQARQRVQRSKWWVTGRAPDGSEKHYLLRVPERT